MSDRRGARAARARAGALTAAGASGAGALSVAAGAGWTAVRHWRGRLNRDTERMRVLADLAAVAYGGRPVQEMAQAIADLLVPRLVDLCLIDLLGADGRLGRLAGTLNGDPATLRGLMERPPGQQSPDRPTDGSLLSAGRHLKRVNDRELQAMASDAQDLELLRRLALGSVIAVPLQAGSRSIGTLVLGTRAPTPRLAEARDFEFARTLGGRVALALDNAVLSRDLSSTERELEVILDSIDAAITVRDRHGRMVYANPAAAELLRLPDGETPGDHAPGNLMDRFDVYDEAGNPLQLDDLPTVRVLAGEAKPASMIVRNVVKETGEERWLLNKATAVIDSAGEVVMAVNLIEDVTETKRGEIAQRLLAATARELAEATDPARTMQAIADAAVPGLADWAGVDLLDAAGQLQTVAIAHKDPEKMRLGWRLRTEWPLEPARRDGLGGVIATGEAQLVPEITDEMLVTGAASPEHLEMLRAVGLKSSMIAPIRVGERILGALSFVSSTSRRFDHRDLQLAIDLGRQAGVFINHAQLYAEQAHIAHTLQAGLIPTALPEVSGWRLSSAYRAAGRANEVGGDFYDVVRCQGGWAAIVGDVVGKGAEAAALTALARHTLAAILESTGDVPTALRLLNQRLRRGSVGFDRLCTIAVITFGADGPAVIYAAGHPLPLLRRAGTAWAVGAQGPLLGYLPDPEIVGAEVTLEVGDQLVLYTDGVLDAVRAPERFGERRLVDAVAGLSPPGSDAGSAADWDAASPAAQIMAAVDRFSEGEQRDDIAVLHLEWVGPGGARDRAPAAGAASAI